METTEKNYKGKKWTVEEDEALRDEFERGFTFDEIAEKHGRTTWAIKCHLEKLGLLEMKCVSKKEDPPPIRNEHDLYKEMISLMKDLNRVLEKIHDKL